MEKIYSKKGLSIVPDIKIRFGSEAAARDVWKNIISVGDEDRRKCKIDDLLELMELDTEKTGFFGQNDKVDCGGGHGFLLNDKQLYYNFLIILKY